MRVGFTWWALIRRDTRYMISFFLCLCLSLSVCLSLSLSHTHILSTLLPLCEDTVRRQARKKTLTRTHPCRHSYFELPTSKTMTDIFLCLSNLVYCILLCQPMINNMCIYKLLVLLILYIRNNYFFSNKKNCSNQRGSPYK